MKAVNIADLKNNLSRYLNEVRRGSEVIVKDRNRAIARIVPLAENEDDEVELMELIAEGVARPPKSSGPFPRSFWRGRLPRASIDVSHLVREDRNAR